MRKWFHVIPRALNAAQCGELVTYAQTHPAIEATVGHGGGKPASPDSNIRVSTLRWLKRADPVLSFLYSIIETETHRANADFFGRDIRSFNDVQFTEYYKDGVYHWHEDCTKVPADTDNKPFDRLLSVCIQLSERNNYEGGEFWIDPNNKRIVGEFWNIGDIVIFPSDLKHKVSPVTDGTRFSLVTWWVGPRL